MPELQQDKPENVSTESSSGPTSMPPTFGQKLVGYQFNPSKDDKVATAKRLCAELAGLLNDDFNNGDETTMLGHILYNHTVGEILNAQMNVVKVLTLKY